MVAGCTLGRGGFYNHPHVVVPHLSHVAKEAGLRVSFKESVIEDTRPPLDLIIPSFLPKF